MNTKLLTPQVTDLVNRWLAIIPKPYSEFAAYRQMIKHPVIATSASGRVLSISSRIGHYLHPTPTEGEIHKPSEIEKEIRRAIAQMDGSFQESVSELCKAVIYGWSFVEVAHTAYRKAGLKGMRSVDIEDAHFEGSDGVIENVLIKYPKEIRVPYKNGIHFSYQNFLSTKYSPYGEALIARVYPYYQLFKIVMSAITIASQRQGTPFIYGKTDTSNTTYLLDDKGVPLLDIDTGLPIEVNKGYAMQSQLEKAENSSAFVIDLMDELNVLQQQTDGSFFQFILSYLEGMMQLSFEVPRTILSTGMSASGDSNLNEGHRSTLDLFDSSVAQLLDEQLIERVVKPILDYNYGEVDDYGTFISPKALPGK